MITEIIMSFFTIIGVCTIAALIAFVVDTEIKPRYIDMLNRQSKIRFLCKHEFEKVWGYELDDDGEKSLIKIRCAKCGKSKELVMKHNPN